MSLYVEGADRHFPPTPLVRTCNECGRVGWIGDHYARSPAQIRHMGPSCTPKTARDARCKPCRIEKTRQPRRSTLTPEQLAIRRAKDAQYRTPEVKLRERLNNYHMTIEQYDEMLASQGGVCALCGEPPADGANRLSVDHDHKCCPKASTSCGKCIRGLIHMKCNSGLGNFGDDIQMLEKAIAYLKSRA